MSENESIFLIRGNKASLPGLLGGTLSLKRVFVGLGVLHAGHQSPLGGEPEVSSLGLLGGGGAVLSRAGPSLGRSPSSCYGAAIHCHVCPCPPAHSDLVEPCLIP